MASSNNTFQHESWSSRTAFLFAIIGAAVGLGNLWRFPYIAGENGGGAFVVIYMAIALGIGIPLIIAELAIGRHGGQSAVTTIHNLTSEHGANRGWHAIGWFSVIAPLLALSFYGVIAGWSIQYVIYAVTGALKGLSPDDTGRVFDGLMGSVPRLVLWQSLFIAGTVFVISRGVRAGIEKVATLLMPALFVLLGILVIYANVTGDAVAGWKFMFNFDFSKVTANTFLLALGQAFFSITIGSGAYITFGAYLKQDTKLAQSAWIICLADLGVALLAGLAIFPIVFGAGLDPSEGPGLMFVILPVAFGKMAGGSVFALLFFILLLFAAFTSSIAMLEPIVSWLEEHRGMPRLKVAMGAGFFSWLVGLGCVFSFNIWADFTPLNAVPLLEGRHIFSIVDFTVSNVMLPLNGLLLALFAGWVLPRLLVRDEIAMKSSRWFSIWLFLIRYVAPVAVGAVLIASVLQSG